MTAVLAPHRIHSTGPHSAPGTTATTRRPALTVIDGGRSAVGMQSRRIYRRRRVVALLTVVIVGWLAVSSAMWIATALVNPTAIVNPTPVPSSGIAGGGAAASQHVVRSGDTLWSIARSLHVDGDIRDAMAQLAETNGDGPLSPGQLLVIPEDLRS